MFDFNFPLKSKGDDGCRPTDMLTKRLSTIGTAAPF